MTKPVDDNTKSIAPMESRLADIPFNRIQMKAKSSASGIIIATVTVVRQSTKTRQKNVTSSMPSTRFSSPCDGEVHQSFGHKHFDFTPVAHANIDVFNCHVRSFNTGSDFRPYATTQFLTNLSRRPTYLTKPGLKNSLTLHTSRTNMGVP